MKKQRMAARTISAVAGGRPREARSDDDFARRWRRAFFGGRTARDAVQSRRMLMHGLKCQLPRYFGHFKQKFPSHGCDG